MTSPDFNIDRTIVATWHQAVDKRIWWQEPNAVRIPVAITLAILWFRRLPGVSQRVFGNSGLGLARTL